MRPARIDSDNFGTREPQGREPVEVDVAALLDLGRRYAVWIAIVGIVGGGLAYLASFLLQPKYEATATLLVTESKFGDTVERDLVPLETFRGLVTSHANLNHAILELQLNQPPYETDVEDLEEAVTVEAIAGTKLLELSVEFPDPSLSRDIANLLAHNTVERNLELSRAEMKGSGNFLESESVEAYDVLRNASDELRQTQQDARLEGTRKELDTELAILGDLTTRISRARTELQESRAKRAFLDGQLKESEETTHLSGKMRLPAMIREKLLPGEGSEADSGFEMLEAEGDTLNPAHSDLQTSYRSEAARVEGLEAEIAHLESAMTKNSARVKSLEKEIARREAALRDARMRYDVAAEQYRAVESTFAQAKVRVSSRSPQLVVIDQAVAPERHVSPRRLLMAAIAAMAAIFAALLVVLVKEYARRRQEA